MHSRLVSTIVGLVLVTSIIIAPATTASAQFDCGSSDAVLVSIVVEAARVGMGWAISGMYGSVLTIKYEEELLAETAGDFASIGRIEEALVNTGWRESGFTTHDNGVLASRTYVRDGKWPCTPPPSGGLPVVVVAIEPPTVEFDPMPLLPGLALLAIVAMICATRSRRQHA